MSQPKEPATSRAPETVPPATDASPPEPLPVHPARLRAEDPLPPSLGVVPLRDLVLYPGMVTPLAVGRPSSVHVVKRAASLGTPVVFVAQRNAELPDPDRDDLYDVGTVGRLLRGLRYSDGNLRVLVQGLRRVRLGSVASETPVVRTRISALDEVNANSGRAEIIRRHLRDEFRAWNQALGKGSAELDAVVNSLEEASRLADYVAGNLPLKPAEFQAILEETDVERRIAMVREHLARERELGNLNQQITNNVQVALDKNQREYYLREQLRAVREELGEIDPTVGEIETLKKRVQEAKMPKEVEEEALRELDRMDRMHREAAEYTVSRTYIDWLLDMPWAVVTEDHIDLDETQKVLDEDHTGLALVKERIVEYLSVRQLNPQSKGPILCFMGPPGVGKTSLGRSIARALGRKFQRISLGGVKDESEIRGHRRTYIGSLPGRIIQAIKRAGSRNPVLVLDEIDKVGNDFRGDPASALLEALDPEQNSAFVDHYLDVAFDLSQVMFICTANVGETIPPALRDRMEIIEIPGYIEEEKLQIAKDHLIPKIRKEHGLKGKQGSIGDEVVLEMVRGWTSEAGVRGLERELAKIARKIARKVVAKKKPVAALAVPDLTEFLGPKKYFLDMAERIDRPGISVGLAWTPVGGEILFIEATLMDGGERKFKVTGQLGEVMRESAETALSWVRSNGAALGVDAQVWKSSDLHVHVPQGAIPKDGPSAGVTIVVALVSLLTGRRVRPDIAMTGEITLRGKVLPVGGIKEKVLAARRAGISHVLLPRQNEKDLLDIPQPLREQITTTFVDSVDDVWPHVLVEASPAAPAALPA
jgi:ATP-dependent Lon protease